MYTNISIKTNCCLFILNYFFGEWGSFGIYTGIFEGDLSGDFSGDSSYIGNNSKFLSFKGELFPANAVTGEVGGES